MTDGAALLRSILAAPDDDAPRLVYADWLDEHGQPERAELIRLQIKMARCRMCHRKDGTERKDSYAAHCGRCVPGRLREYQLLNEHPPYLYGQFADSLTDLGLRIESIRIARGFLDSLACTAADWLAHADAITAAHPVREVRLTTWPERYWLGNLEPQWLARGLTWESFEAVRNYRIDEAGRNVGRNQDEVTIDYFRVLWPSVKTWHLPQPTCVVFPPVEYPVPESLRGLTPALPTGLG